MAGGLFFSWQPCLPHPRIQPQGLDFAGPVPDRACEPHPGKRSSSRAIDDLLYPATARGALRLPSRACCKSLEQPADPVVPAAVVCCDGLNLAK
jgi:hypothetical protein